jgi:hypothetical protein
MCKKIWLITSLLLNVLLLITSLSFAYFWIDRGVSMAYGSSDGLYSAARREERLKSLLGESFYGIPKKDFIKVLTDREYFSDADSFRFKIDGDNIYLDNTCFIFKDGKLIGVK